MSLPENNKFTKKPEESQSLGSEFDEKIQNVSPTSPDSFQNLIDESLIEALDTSMFDFSNIVSNETVLPAIKKQSLDKAAKDIPNQSNKVGRLRKFQGHRKPLENDDTEISSEMSFDDRVEYFKERLKMGDSIEQMALSIAIRESSKVEGEKAEGENVEEKVKPAVEQKGYSPNRSFTDLLQENDRRKVQHSRTNIESIWNEASKSRNNEPQKKGSNFKIFILSGLIAIALGVAGILFYINSKAKTVTDKAGISESNGNPSTTQVNIGEESTNVELTNKVINLLKEYHDTSDQNKKASLCRVPNRTLSDMKKYYSKREKKSEVTNVKVAEAPITMSDIKFTQAKVTFQVDGVEDNKYAYFSEDSSGNLKLDWHSYVGFEAVSWKSYLASKEITPMIWHLTVSLNGDLHPDFSEDKYVAIVVKSWALNAVDSTNAILSKEDPMYQKLMDAYESGQRTFILKVYHLGDIANSLVVDEIISLSEFYEGDIDAVIE